MSLETSGNEEIRDVSFEDLLNESVSGQDVSKPAEGSNEQEVLRQDDAQEGREEVETVEETPAPTLKDRLVELGFEDLQDDNEAQQRLLEAYAQQTAEQRYYQEQLQLLQYQMRNMMAQQGQQPQQTQQTQNKPEPFYNPPQLDVAAATKYIAGRDEKGKIQWQEGTPPQIIDQYNAREEYYTRHAERLVKNWDQVEASLEERILAKAQEMFEKNLETRAKQTETESYVNQQIREHESVLYQINPVTKQVRLDPATGNPMLSEAGVRLNGILSELEQSGMTDPVSCWKYGMQLYKAQYGDLGQKGDQIQTARVAAMQKQLVKQATHTPSAAGQERTSLSGRPQTNGVGSKLFSNSDFSVRFD